LVLAPGAWADQLTGFPVSAERQIFYWVQPDFAAGPPFAAYVDGHPIYVEETDRNGVFYGFPMIDGPEGGLKFAFYRQNDGQTTSPDTVDRTVHDHEIAAVLARARQLFPFLTSRVVAARTCLYASAPDDSFLIGCLPAAPQVVVAAGFSGHGFKFVPVIGQIVCDLVRDGATGHDISLFALDRPALAHITG
jgi:glycine/D-amino acid oxidase-like deaminating enzyme